VTPAACHDAPVAPLPPHSSLTLAEPDRARLVDLGRTTLRLWEWGDPANPPVVLVHGGWDHGRMWDGIAPAVAARGFHAVAVDLRGHGDSGRLGDSGACWLAWNLDLATLIHDLGAPAGLVGHSMGGGQVLSVASAFPELVSWVLNLDGLGPGPEMMIVQDHAAHAAQWLADAEAVWSKPQREYASLEDLARRRTELNIRLPYEWALHLAIHGAKRGPGGGYIWKSDPVMRIGGPGLFGEEGLRAGYLRIRCPVAVLTGEEPDTWGDLPLEIAAARVACIREGTLTTVPGAGHYLHIERPDAVLAALDDLVRRNLQRKPQ
jgi:pimeloyl-ACP methyl ester carboxylesterase